LDYFDFVVSLFRRNNFVTVTKFHSLDKPPSGRFSTDHYSGFFSPRIFKKK
jgi:hypothetical protein